MNRPGLWKTTLSGPAFTGGKLGHAPRLRFGVPPLATHALLSMSRPSAMPQAAKIPGPDRPRPPGAPGWWTTGRARHPARCTTGSVQPHRSSSVARGLDLLGDRAALHRHQRTGRARPAASTSRAAAPAARPRARSPRRTGARRAARRRGRGPPRPLLSPRSAATSSRKVVRRSSGSTRVTVRSGRAIASTRPGQAGTGADVAHRRRRPGSARPSSAQFTRCRSHSRGASRGPISPRTTPSVASSSAYRSASAEPLRRKHPPRHVRRGGCFT